MGKYCCLKGDEAKEENISSPLLLMHANASFLNLFLRLIHPGNKGKNE